MENNIKEIVVVQKKVGCKPVVKTIKDNLEILQEEVGGYIQNININKNLHIYVDEDAKMKGLKENLFTDLYTLRGDLLIVKSDDEGELCSLNDDEVNNALTMLGALGLDFKNRTMNLGMLLYLISTEFKVVASSMDYNQYTERFGYALEESLSKASNDKISDVLKRACNDLNIKENIVDEFVSNGGDLYSAITNLKFVLGNIIVHNSKGY